MNYHIDNRFSILPAVVLMSMVNNREADAQMTADHQPNILFAISDDQSFPHASAYGTPAISTPTFDSLAREGVLFTNAFVAAPQSSPSRAAILTGRNIWQLEEAGTHGSLFPKKFKVFTDVLEAHGYAIGFTGKAWGPGNWQLSGWQRNPVGPEYNRHTLTQAPYSGIKNVDYVSNFKEFIRERKDLQPFFFWYGSHEPHRDFEYGSGLHSGKALSEADVPPFLPQDDVVRQDILDYNTEIEWFDKKLGEMINYLREIGELENTIIVVTSDNGMAFPYAKANLYELGTHVPLLISGKKYFEGERKINDLVSLIDLAPTFLELTGTPLYQGITGKSLASLLSGKLAKAGREHREFILTGRERHTHARPDNLGYPSRAIRTKDFLYIKNYKPERWPVGNPPEKVHFDSSVSEDIKPIGGGFADIDESPTKERMIKNSCQFPGLFKKAFEKRPAEELYDIKNDPYCLVNICDDNRYSEIKDHLRRIMEEELKTQGDPRVWGYGEIFESYPRFGLMRNFSGFKKRGKYNERYQKKLSNENR